MDDLAFRAGLNFELAGKPPDMMKILLILLCLVLPWLAVLFKEGPSLKVLWAFLFQLLGHIPGVLYGLVQVTKD